MSRSDNTEPLRLLDGYERYARAWGLPRRTGRYLRRRWHKQQRGQVRQALSRQQEPEPSRPRHGVIYNYW